VTCLSPRDDENTFLFCDSEALWKRAAPCGQPQSESDGNGMPRIVRFSWRTWRALLRPSKACCVAFCSQLMIEFISLLRLRGPLEEGIPLRTTNHVTTDGMCLPASCCLHPSLPDGRLHPPAAVRRLIHLPVYNCVLSVMIVAGCEIMARSPWPSSTHQSKNNALCGFVNRDDEALSRSISKRQTPAKIWVLSQLQRLLAFHGLVTRCVRFVRLMCWCRQFHGVACRGSEPVLPTVPEGVGVSCSSCALLTSFCFIVRRFRRFADWVTCWQIDLC
jgi:hypothetical protein